MTITLPYITSARDGVKRLGMLLETYGTYEMNGIAFQDEDEIWWFETIGGHNWIAKKVPDDTYVVMPNQLGMDFFDFEDAYGEQAEHMCWWFETIGGHNWIAKKVPDDTYVVMPNQLGMDFFDFEDAYGEQAEHMCSLTLKTFVEENHLDRRMNPEEIFNPRDAFGSHDDGDHIYNTPRAWAMLRYFNPRSFVWDGPNADFTPESDDLPWAFVPERKITLDEVKWALSNHYQGTPYDVYGKSFDSQMAGKYRAIGVNRNNVLGLVQIRPYMPELSNHYQGTPYDVYGKSFDSQMAGKYRAIGVNRNNVLGLVQIRPYMPEPLKAIQWIALGSNVFNEMVPFYTRINKTPAYLAGAHTKPTTDNFYWTNRMIDKAHNR